MEVNLQTNGSKKIKFTQIPKESIKLFAKHHKISEEASEILTEDVNYRLREIIGNAVQYMRHAHRRRLTINDFNKALKDANCSIMYGNTSSEPMKYIKLKNNLFAPIEEVINLKNINYTIEGTLFSKPKIIGEWLIVGDNTNPKSYQNNGKASEVNLLTSDQIEYYDAITKVILANNKETFTFVLNDLRKNPNIQPLLPFLLNFIYKGIERYYNEFSFIEKSFLVLESLLFNNNLYFDNENCLTLFMQCLIFCIVEPKLANDSDHWSLRDHAVLLLVRFLKKWATSTNHLYSLALDSLKDELNKPSIQFSSHYGILNAILILDVTVLDDTFFHLLPNYLQLIDHVMSQKGNTQLKLEADNFRGILILFCERLLKNLLNEIEKKKQVILYDTNTLSNMQDHNTDASLVPTCFQKYHAYYKCFGDTLAIRMPSLSIKFPEKHFKSIVEQNSQTNELVLEMFKEEQEEEINENFLKNIFEDMPNNSSKTFLKVSDDEMQSICKSTRTISTNSLNSPNQDFIENNSNEDESNVNEETLSESDKEITPHNGKEALLQSDKEMLPQTEDRLSLNKEMLFQKGKDTPPPNDSDMDMSDREIQSVSDNYSSQLSIETLPQSNQDAPSQSGEDILIKSGQNNISLHIKKNASLKNEEILQNDEEIPNDKYVPLLSSKEIPSESENGKLTPSKSESSSTSENEGSSFEKITDTHNLSESDSEMEIDDLNNEHNEMIYKNQLKREELITRYLNLSKMGSLMTIL